ncbi:MAG: periplasmic heavy metal sensor [Syntrophorhabdaceae bacterium]|nr:periplasmic heavy metal sensor [Syntrophorhabdaceae bacterium]
MKKKILIGLLVAFAVAFIASIAMAGHGFGKGMGFGPYPGCGVPPVSNLTPEQAEKIKTIQQAHIKDVAPLKQQLLAKKTELRAEWLSKNPDQAKIIALQKEILNLQGKILEKATQTRFEVRKVLTPDQQAQLALYGCGRGFGKGGMGPMGPHMGYMDRF